jgi:hypothetical protein
MFYILLLDFTLDLSDFHKNENNIKTFSSFLILKGQCHEMVVEVRP